MRLGTPGMLGGRGAMGYRFRPGDPGNFEGKAQVQVFAMIGAAGALAAAVGPLLGGC
jgi:hypothetical protein